MIFVSDLFLNQEHWIINFKLLKQIGLIINDDCNKRDLPRAQEYAIGRPRGIQPPYRLERKHIVTT
jgi:hypothetical protein